MGKSKYYIWSAIGQYGTQVLGFVGNILIARILMPDDYGLIALLAIFLGLAMTFTDSGFADCLIRKPNVDDVDYGTVATFNTVVALFLYFVIFFTAPYISNYYHRSELTSVARVISISIVLKALILTRITRFRKELHFKKLAIMQLQGSIISIFVTYILAQSGYGYWALALQPVCMSVSYVVFLIFFCKWLPIFKFNLGRFKDMFGFSINLLVSYISNTVGQNIYSIIIGKFYPITSLGFYNQAKKMYEVPTNGLNTVILTTSYSIIAKEYDLEIRRAMYVNIAHKFLTIQSLMVFGMLGFAEPVWYFLLGDKWMSSVIYFKLFMLISLVIPLVTVNSNIAKIHNKPKLYRNLTFFRNGLQVLALLICATNSIKVILYGQIIAAYISVLIDMIFCGKIIDFGFWRQLKLLFETLIKPAVAFFIAFFVSHIFNLGIYLTGFLFIAVFLIIIIIIYITTKDKIFFKTFQYLKSQLKERK